MAHDEFIKASVDLLIDVATRPPSFMDLAIDKSEAPKNRHQRRREQALARHHEPHPVKTNRGPRA